MRKALLIIFAVSLGLALVGCNKDEAPAAATPAGGVSAAPAKGGNGEAITGEMTPGPGAAEAESRAGSKLGDK
jgi:hypothetical protein